MASMSNSPASCYLLEAEGFRLLIDLGNGALGVLQRYAGLSGPGKLPAHPTTVTRMQAIIQVRERTLGNHAQSWPSSWDSASSRVPE